MPGTPTEACAVCQHPWIAHVVADVRPFPDFLHHSLRGGTPDGTCGGFYNVSSCFIRRMPLLIRKIYIVKHTMGSSPPMDFSVVCRCRSLYRLWANVCLGPMAPYSHTQCLQVSTSLHMPMLPPPLLSPFFNLPLLPILLLIIPSHRTFHTPLLSHCFHTHPHLGWHLLLCHPSLPCSPPISCRFPPQPHQFLCQILLELPGMGFHCGWACALRSFLQ